MWDDDGERPKSGFLDPCSFDHGQVEKTVSHRGDRLLRPSGKMTFSTDWIGSRIARYDS